MNNFFLFFEFYFYSSLAPSLTTAGIQTQQYLFANEWPTNIYVLGEMRSPSSAPSVYFFVPGLRPIAP